jgi:hypothetical protein
MSVPGEAQGRATSRIHHLPVQPGMVSAKSFALEATMQGLGCGSINKSEISNV